jgi:2-polyprenyl-6-methoxyphenol hydroxylase-like FAD-dependent oxidoreductase
LTVGADGRFSKVRSLAGFEPVKGSPPMDVLWFRLPRKPADPHDTATFYIGGGILVILLDRGTDWQIGYVITKGSFRELKSAGIEALRKSLAGQVPWMFDRVEFLQDWSQVSVLSVESSRVPTWYKPGFLLIGDAAHVMTPVGGVGINYAIQDAVESANVLAGPLREGRLELKHLAEVQKLREWPVKVIQAFQGFMQQKVVKTALAQDRPFKVPLLLRIISKLPLLRNIPARLVAFGPRRVRVK